MYMYTYIYSQKLSPTFLWVLKVWSSWEVAPTIFKITLEETVFSKMVPNFTILEGIFHCVGRTDGTDGRDGRTGRTGRTDGTGR